jgi:hypothetical protein
LFSIHLLTCCPFSKETTKTENLEPSEDFQEEKEEETEEVEIESEEYDPWNTQPEVSPGP